MRLLSVAAIAAASTVTLTQIAKAADGPPFYNWTGPYIGIAAGYGWGHSDQTDRGIPCEYFGTCSASPGGNGGAGGNGGFLAGSGGAGSGSSGSLVAAEALEETLASLATAVLVAQEVLGALAVQEAPEETLASLATEVLVAQEVLLGALAVQEAPEETLASLATEVLVALEVLEALVAQEAQEETLASYSATAAREALVGMAPTRRAAASSAGRWATTGKPAHGSLASRATTPGPISKAARTVAARLLQFRMPAPPALNHWARCAGALAMQ